MSTRKHPAKLIDAPMALASDGTPLLNITHVVDATDPVAVVRTLLAAGHTLFIGVVVPARCRRRMAKDIDDAATEVACRIGGRVVRPTKR
jgi:streptomycin 6-kinase